VEEYNNRVDETVDFDKQGSDADDDE